PHVTSDHYDVAPVRVTNKVMAVGYPVGGQEVNTHLIFHMNTCSCWPSFAFLAGTTARRITRKRGTIATIVKAVGGCPYYHSSRVATKDFHGRFWRRAQWCPGHIMTSDEAQYHA